MLSIYALIAQIMLVNLLIAMMGDSYSNVKENSGKEWKFSRYSLVSEFSNTSFDPPPFNLIMWPVKGVLFLIERNAKRTEKTLLEPLDHIGHDEVRDDLKKKMGQAMLALKEGEDEEQRKTVTYVGEKIQSQIRDLMSEHLTDRTFMHDKFAALETRLTRDQSILGAIDSLRKEISGNSHAVPILLSESVQGKTAEIVSKSLKSLRVQSVDVHDDNHIGFVKFKADLLDSQNKPVTGFTFVRGDAAAILILLKVEDIGKEYIIMTVHRMSAACAELPTGILDGSEFCGGIPLLLEKKSGISIKQHSLIDLTAMTMRENPLYHAGSHISNESIPVYLWHQTVKSQYIVEIQGKIHPHPEEQIFFKLVELQDVWKNTTDATALAAVFLYQTLLPKIKLAKV